MFRVFKDKVTSIIKGKNSSKYEFDDISIESTSENELNEDDYVLTQVKSKKIRSKGHGLSIFDSINKSLKTNKMNSSTLTIKNNIPFSNDAIESILSPGKRKREDKTKFDNNNDNENNNQINNENMNNENNNQLNNDDSRFNTVRTQSNKVLTKLSNNPPANFIKNESIGIDDEALSSVDMLFSKVRHNHYDLVKSILDNKTAHNEDFNKICVDNNGNTLLHICCQNNLKKMAMLVIQCGVFVNQKNNKGLTSLDYCDIYKFHALGDYIIEHGGEVGALLNKPISFR